MVPYLYIASIEATLPQLRHIVLDPESVIRLITLVQVGQQITTCTVASAYRLVLLELAATAPSKGATGDRSEEQRELCKKEE